jgi:hypothetical protein
MGWLWEPLEYLGESLVFIGVLGEILCDRKLVLKKDEARRDAIEGFCSWILVAGLAISLSALIGTNEHFSGTIAELNLKASQADERARKNDAEAATQRARAAKDEKDLAELQKASMPRVINEDRLASKMRKYSGTSIEFTTLKDFEPLQLTRAIKDALLVRAHWKTGALTNINWSDPGDPVPIELSRVGIWIEVPPSTPERPSARLKPIAEALAAALREEGLETHTRRGHLTSTFGTTADGAVHLYVSLKPFPGMPDDLRVVSITRN